MKKLFRAASALTGAILLVLALAQAATGQEVGEAASPPSAASELLSGADGEAPPAAFAPNSGLNLVWACAMFVLVLTLLFLSLKALGRFSRFRGRKGKGSIFTLRDILPLDNRKYLAAVEVEGRLLVLGVCQDRIVALAEWARPARTGDVPEDFAFRLREDEDFDISISDARDGGGPK